MPKKVAEPSLSRTHSIEETNSIAPSQGSMKKLPTKKSKKKAPIVKEVKLTSESEYKGTAESYVVVRASIELLINNIGICMAEEKALRSKPGLPTKQTA